MVEKYFPYLKKKKLTKVNGKASFNKSQKVSFEFKQKKKKKPESASNSHWLHFALALALAHGPILPGTHTSSRNVNFLYLKT